MCSNGTDSGHVITEKSKLKWIQFQKLSEKLFPKKLNNEQQVRRSSLNQSLDRLDGNKETFLIICVRRWSSFAPVPANLIRSSSGHPASASLVCVCVWIGRRKEAVVTIFRATQDKRQALFLPAVRQKQPNVYTLKTGNGRKQREQHTTSGRKSGSQFFKSVFAFISFKIGRLECLVARKLLPTRRPVVSFDVWIKSIATTK